VRFLTGQGVFRRHDGRPDDPGDQDPTLRRGVTEACSTGWLDVCRPDGALGIRPGLAETPRGPRGQLFTKAEIDAGPTKPVITGGGFPLSEISAAIAVGYFASYGTAARLSAAANCGKALRILPLPRPAARSPRMPSHTPKLVPEVFASRPPGSSAK